MLNKETLDSASGLTKSFYLLLLAVSGNFVAETLGCSTRKLLNENMYVKQFLILFLTYFTIGFVNEDDNPFVNMKYASLIWVLFLIFTKMSLSFTIFVFSMLSIMYIIQTFINYYKKEEINKKIVEKLEGIVSALLYIIPGTIGVGFSLYAKKQYTDHSDSWSTLKFLLGTVNCDSIK